MRKRKSLPSVGKIFDYWKDKYDKITFYFVDWGEPSCPGCGNQIHNIEFENKEKYLSYLKQGNFVALWNTCKRLERHHIIPHSLGGTDELENLFLLCADCHAQAPTVKDSRAFFNWLKTPKSHHYFNKYIEEAKKGWDYIKQNYGTAQQERILQVLSKLNQDALFDFLASKDNELTSHFDKRSGSKVPYISYIHIIAEGIVNGELTG